MLKVNDLSIWTRLFFSATYKTFSIKGYGFVTWIKNIFISKSLSMMPSKSLKNYSFYFLKFDCISFTVFIAKYDSLRQLFIFDDRNGIFLIIFLTLLSKSRILLVLTDKTMTLFSMDWNKVSGYSPKIKCL